MTRDGGARKARAPRPPRIDTLIVGAGQAGVALSHHLAAAGEEHVLLERGRVGQRWHERWDSLTLLSPNWMNRLPGEPDPTDRDGFLSLAGFAAHLESYARSHAAPVEEGVEVERIERRGDGFRIRTTSGAWLARSVVLATGDAADPHLPLAPPQEPLSLHSSEYRRPELVPDGPVLVVGAGTSGQQLALELQQAGRDVVLAAGRHSRAPRRYRGRDIFEWAYILGDFDRTIDELPDVEAAKRVPLFPLSGANGGEDLGLDRLAAAGVTIAGRLAGFDGTRAVFADDLAANVAAADVRLRKLLQRIDAHPLAAGREPEPLPDVILPRAPRTLDLRRIGAIVWATGFRRGYPWLHVPGVLDRRGEIEQRRGTTRVSGLYTLGLAYQYRRNSHFIGGVGRDAETVARSIVHRRAGRDRARTPAVSA
ncbi:MAG TPA: NAD(P)-binding domain-containing protein [Gaiellaceae bacterium]|jgi:putative flavoprotein involved in K+ transport|nr:NAD(P)-binding domain-containing protein [Gaiellaceae bacterium]